MQDFKRLLVRQRAHQLTLAVHHTLQGVPRGGYAGLRPQALRAAASIPANIPEGCGHGTSRELLRFVAMAIASASELQYHLLLARDLQLTTNKHHDTLDARIVEVRRMLSGFARAIRAEPARPPSNAVDH